MTNYNFNGVLNNKFIKNLNNTVGHEQCEQPEENKDTQPNIQNTEEKNDKQILQKINNEINKVEPVKSNQNEIRSNQIKNNIKLMCKKIDSNEALKNNTKFKSDPYVNDIPILEKSYKNDQTKHDFILNVNTSTCSTPLFNMRTFADLGFYFNFIIHDFDSQKINNLIMCRDIHKWMSTSSLSSEDLEDEFCPIYYIKKMNGLTDVFEYLKLFIHTDDNGTKICFIQKGCDYLEIKNDINELIEKDLIKDLLLTKHYNNYNLSSNEGVSEFLEKFLSLVLIPETLIGEQVLLDIENYTENKKTFDYHFNTINSDSNMFKTTI